MKKEDFDKYPKTDMFQIINNMGIPHTYCIGNKHLNHASKYFNGVLNTEVIKDLEKTGNHYCYVKGCSLSYAEHEIALIVEVNFDGDINDAPGLQEYLSSCLVQAQEDGATGFAFVQKK